MCAVFKVNHVLRRSAYVAQRQAVVCRLFWIYILFLWHLSKRIHGSPTKVKIMLFSRYLVRTYQMLQCSYFRWIPVCDNKLGDQIASFSIFCADCTKEACYPLGYLSVTQILKFTMRQKHITSSLVPVFYLSTNRIHAIRNVQLRKSYLRDLTLQPKVGQIWTL